MLYGPLLNTVTRTADFKASPRNLYQLNYRHLVMPFHTRSQLFTKFIKVIYHQLKYGLQKESSGGPEMAIHALLDDSWLASDSFMHLLCKDFFALVEKASVVDGDLLLWTKKFKELLETRVGWEFQKSTIDGFYFEEDDEYAPVVEMLDGSMENIWLLKSFTSTYLPMILMLIITNECEDTSNNDIN